MTMTDYTDDQQSPVVQKGCYSYQWLDNGMTLPRLVTLSIASLRNVDIESNYFYDRGHQLYDTALLARCFAQHDLATDHIMHFI